MFRLFGLPIWNTSGYYGVHKTDLERLGLGGLLRLQ